MGYLAHTKQILLQEAAGTATAVPTYQSIGLYWSPADGSATNQCNVQYRVQGTTAWSKGYPLWYDGRALGGRPAEYRGSLVLLQPGTTYEIQLTLASGTTTTTTARTWTDPTNLPIAQTVTVPSGNAYTVSQSGTATGYILYTGAPGITITGGLTISASYVIVRGLTITGGTNGITLTNNVHDVIIEKNDISQWGSTNCTQGNCPDTQAGIKAADGGTFTHLTIQRNKIHNPAVGANDWCETGLQGNHPNGPRAVALPGNATNNVIRYNEISSDDNHIFNDTMGENSNFSYSGFPNRDTDINGNILSYSADDNPELEGADMNIRFWGNYVDKSFTGPSSASVALGPLYIFRNVTGLSSKCARQNGGWGQGGEHGPFNKSGDSDGFGGGREYVFNNTILQPGGTGGFSDGIEDSGGPINNHVSRNNIWVGCYSVGNGGNNDFDYDLCNGSQQGAHSVSGKATYVAGEGDTAGSNGMYHLATNSPGYHAGQVLPNFNDDFGAQPDMGAQASGAPKMEFGVNAYTTNTQPTGTTTIATTLPSPPLATPTLFCMGSCPTTLTAPVTAVPPIQTTTTSIAPSAANMQSMMQSLFQQLMQFFQNFFSFF